jgi:hypothetical protein
MDFLFLKEHIVWIVSAVPVVALAAYLIRCIKDSA